MLTDAGAAFSALSASPVRVHKTYVLPANTAYLWFYFAPISAGQDMDLVALWAHKGADTLGIEWPTFNDEDYLRLSIATTNTNVNGQVAKLGYVVDATTKITQAASSLNLAGSTYGNLARDLVFMGWAEKLAPAGVSFNAINIKSISRTPGTLYPWKTLNLVVRTGASPENAGATVVAVGSAQITSTLDALADIMILLRDPVTGDVKTLNDASFSGGAYMIGVYALMDTGSPAACGEPLGVMPNAAGQCYYHTSTVNQPLTGAWFAASAGSNYRLAFEHFLLTTPVEGLKYAPTQAFTTDLGLLTPIPAPEMVVPPTIYGVQGRECNVYFDNLYLASASDYLQDVTAAESISQHQAERWTWVPAGALEAGTLSFSAADKRTGTALTTKTTNQRAAAATAGNGLNKKVLVIGDSLVNAGVITQTLLDIAATDVMGVTLLGTRGTAPNLHEGRGGWSINDYATVGRTYYTFTVSGVAVAPAINSTKYSNNGAVYTVQEINLSGGAGTIVCSVDSGGAPTANGTLTRTFGSGDATIAFSASAAVSGNPFWISGAVNFAGYLAAHSIAAPDWVFIALGINDIFFQVSDASASAAADAAFTLLDTLIASIKSADVNTKIGIMLPSPPSSSQDAFGANYRSGQTRWRDKRNILIWSRQLITKYTGQEASRIYIVPSNTALDTVNNMIFAAADPVNSRNAGVMVARQNNGVHPATSGYQQIADAVWAVMKYYA